MEAISNPLQACKILLLKPNPVFAIVKDKQNWSWVPFFLVAITSVIPSLLYFNMVDMEWYQNTLVSSMTGDVSPAEQRMLEQSMNADSLANYTILSNVFGLISANGLLAAYLFFATRHDEELVWGFTDWYGFGWWLAVPTTVTSIFAALVIILFGGAEMSPTMMTPTSLAFLFGLAIDSPSFALFQGIRFESFWMMYLTVVGLMHWTNTHYKKAIVIAVTPYIVLWAAMALLF